MNRYMDFCLLHCLLYSRDRLRLKLTVKNISFLHVKNYVAYYRKLSCFSTVFHMNTTQLIILVLVNREFIGLVVYFIEYYPLKYKTVLKLTGKASMISNSKILQKLYKMDKKINKYNLKILKKILIIFNDTLTLN